LSLFRIAIPPRVVSFSREHKSEVALVKKKFSHAVIAFSAIALLLPALIFAQQKQQTPTVNGSTSPGKPVDIGPPLAKRSNRNRSASPIEDDVQEALKLIEEHYVEGNKLDYNAVFKSSITGMLRTLDPHSNYFDREEFDELKTDQRSEYFGIGASIFSYVIGDTADTFITATFEGSPAARAGLRFGDRIVAVDGVKMTGKQSIEVRDKIRGPRGSTVKVTIEHAEDKREEVVQIIRDTVPQPSIPDAYMIKPGVGYIDMSRGFNYSTSEELQAALDELHGKGMTSLVLDLRDNPGGFLDQAINVAEKFLRSGQLILTQKGRRGYTDRSFESRNVSPDMTPLVILVNGNTASASEIVAGAMQDHDRALIVGQPSFGKGLVQSIIPLEYGSGLTLTSAKYYTPSGRLIQRDYSNGGFYDYYTHGGLNRTDPKNPNGKPAGQERRTDTGRPVYGGGGIAPDDTIEPRGISLYQRRLLNPIFVFSRDMANGSIPGFESYKVQKPIDFGHALTPADFSITDAVFKAFKEYAAGEPAWKTTAAQLDRNRGFIATQLRFNLVTAAYGRVMAQRVFVVNDDPQVAKAVDALPRARDLAMNARSRAVK
jgi:carboxyl-terminal processing protease